MKKKLRKNRILKVDDEFCEKGDKTHSYFWKKVEVGLMVNEDKANPFV